MLNFKKGNVKLSFPILSKQYQCRAAVPTTKTPTLNGVEEEGVWIVLFSEVTPFKDNFSAILWPIVAKLQKKKQTSKTIAEIDTIHDRLNGVVALI